MSAHKKKGVVAAKNTGMVVKNVGRGPINKKLWAKLGGIAALAVVVVILIGSLSKHFHKSSSSPSTTLAPSSLSPAEQKENAKAAALNDTYNQALNLTADGHADQAQALYDSQLTKTSDKTVQAQIYDSKSAVALNAQDYQNALAYGQKSEALNPTAASAGDIAVAAEKLGDKTTALKYYKLQLSRQSTTKIKGANASLEAKIKELGG